MKARENLLLIAGLFEKFNEIVQNIGLFNVIFRSFNIFVDFLRTLDDEILSDKEKRALLATLIHGLVDDLEQWILNVFLKQTTHDIHYLDASFAENCLEIENIFLENDKTEELNEEEEEDCSLEFF